METADKKNYEIPSVSKTIIDLSETGLKNLAGWIARYNGFGLRLDESSEHVEELLENGTLSKFEPSLVGLRPCCWYKENGPDEFERYEFAFTIEDFTGLGEPWTNLYFYFKCNKCKVVLIGSCGNDDKEEQWKISNALKVMCGALDMYPLTLDDFTIDVTWKEADRIICAYLQYMNNPIIPVPPMES